jgi:hypothetical protein
MSKAKTFSVVRYVVGEKRVIGKIVARGLTLDQSRTWAVSHGTPG